MPSTSIEERARATAKRIVAEVRLDHYVGSQTGGLEVVQDEIMCIIAAALWDEREACAKVAEDEKHCFSTDSTGVRGPLTALQAAAAAIRARG